MKQSLSTGKNALDGRAPELTRERLLDEAEILFAQKGYHAVSVREITQAADCNLAAVNYHFGSKHNLYLEVFRSRWLPRAERLYRRVVRAISKGDAASPAVVVEALARAFLEGFQSDGERSRHLQLISRELAQPSEAFRLVAGQAFRPLFEILVNSLRSGLSNYLSDEQLALNVFGVFAIVLYFNFARPMITSFTGCIYDDAFKSRLVDHIVRFALRGLDGNRKEGIT